MSSDEHKQRYINRIKEVVNTMIYKEVDGYDVIQFEGAGFWRAESLRVIADYLDERNKPWDHVINEGICHQCGRAKEMSREITENGDPIFYDCQYCTTINMIDLPSVSLAQLKELSQEDRAKVFRHFCRGCNRCLEEGEVCYCEKY